MSEAPKKKLSAARRRSFPSPARSSGFSQKAKSSARTGVKGLRLVTSEDIEKKGAAAVLLDVKASYTDYGKRSHDFRRIFLASVYQVALEAKQKPEVWADLRESSQLKNAPLAPKSPRQALRFALMAAMGTDEVNRKKASKEASCLRPLFDNDSTVDEVLSFLSSTKVSKPRAARKASSKRPTAMFRIDTSGDYELRVKEGCGEIIEFFGIKRDPAVTSFKLSVRVLANYGDGPLPPGLVTAEDDEDSDPDT